MRKMLPVMVYLMLLSNAVIAQTNPYLGSPSVGRVEPKRSADSSLGPGTVECADWVGQRFIFLPKPHSSEHYGYQGFRLPYAEWVGKIMTVVSVSKDDMKPEVRFRAENGTEVAADHFLGYIMEIAPVRDLDFAREHWIGKALWLRVPTLNTYDDIAEKYGSVRVGRATRVNVKDVVLGHFDFMPVRFILSTDDGEEGFVDVRMSGTNVRETMRRLDGNFSDSFYTSDPRRDHQDWPARVWDAVKTGSVYIGMTAEQAETSWGKPRSINRTTTEGQTTEQWVYRDAAYLYVRNGIVTAVQN